MVDFSKILGPDKIKALNDPIKIFKSLDKESGKEYLRPSQEAALKNWYENSRDQKDIIIKLHTGQGKTLIGLVILQSFLNEEKGPAIYICPNNYLVDQTIAQANSFGINTVKIGTDNRLPASFLNSKAILITNCKKLFNGKSIFGVTRSNREIISIGAIVIDDAHKCVDIIRESFSFIINRFIGNLENPLYRKLFNLFYDALSNQAPGTLFDIEEGENKYLIVPYWNWMERYQEILSLLKIYKHEKEILFTWDLVNDIIQDCFCFVSGRKIEISPRIIPIQKFPSFFESPKRIFLSATLTEDAFLIRDLGIDPNAVSSPIIYEEVKYSGERMVLIPTLIDPYLPRLKIIENLQKILNSSKDFGIFSLVPSFYRSEIWEEKGGKVLSINEIYASLSELNNKIKTRTVDKLYILVNEYDGIDLPDQICRILILDNTPHYISLFDKYKKDMMPNSKILQRNIAQRIEQGMGRGIRGSSDWCIVILLGDNITKFISIENNRQYFSNEVQRQIQICEELTEILKEEGASWIVIEKLINQCLHRDQGWKEYYRTRMEDLTLKTPSESFITRFQKEREAEKYYFIKQYDKAIDAIRELMNSFSLSEAEEGWYIQLLSIYTYRFNKGRSMELQLKAHSLNQYLSAPIGSITYEKLQPRDDQRSDIILNWIKTHENFNIMIVDLNNTLDILAFGVQADLFEEAFDNLGNILGFQSQRPEKKFKKGPDVLWNISLKEFWIIECKNEVKLSRDYISKSECGQVSNSIGWYKENYSEDSGLPIIIHPSCEFNEDAYIHDSIYCLDKEGLNTFKDRISNFYNSFKDIPFNKISKEHINKKLVEYSLEVSEIKTEILEKVRRKKTIK